ncbi:FkbM family methyltransferase [Roseomonas sp. PWR1]|uniref:FkbM family methyltransferase n=1 Tax=Roseomonas nitratireducens TaxID=2820810 RepID=A0ABS4AQQ8_9PROT|nr:FkbM family methyltransferase [Neoroseomonas nitratireducens]
MTSQVPEPAARRAHIRRDLEGGLVHHVRKGLIGGINRERQGHVRFLQIGGNDGVLADPLFGWHKEHPWTGAIVEPVPNYFAKLKSLHADRSGIQLFQCAVSDTPGELTLWFVGSRAASRYPDWTQGLASSSREHLLRHGVAHEDCEQIVVPTKTPEQICAEASFERIDLMCIDVEGHELPILRAFPFERVRPAITIFEAWHMDDATRATLRDVLDPKGLQLFFLGEDGYAVDRDDFVRTGLLRELEEYPPVISRILASP